MPHTNVLPTYELILSSREFRLITLGLAGKLKDKEDIAEALKLNTHLCAHRAKHTKDQAEIAHKALCEAQLLENPNVPPKQSS